MEGEIFQKDKEITDLHEKIKSLERPMMTDISIQVTDEFIFPSLLTRSNYVPNDSFNCQQANESVSKLAQCTDNIHNLPEEFKFNRILESTTSSNDFSPRLSKDDINGDNCDLHQIYAHYQHNAECYFVYEQNTLKLQNLRVPNCQCMRNDAQVICININVLQNLSMKLQAQERKKQQLQECFKQQQYHTERVLQRKSFTIFNCMFEY